ncbi:MAG: HDIG domain-containing protein [bacterium]|nr:HDIG domain-containing protein [bacterium]
MIDFKWREWARKILLSLVQKVSEDPNTSSLKIRKESYFAKDFHVPIWLIGILLYLILIVILVVALGVTLNNFIVITITMSAVMFFGVYFFKKYAPDILECDDSLSLVGLTIISFLVSIIIVKHSGRAHFLVTPLPAAAMILNILLGPLVAFIVSIVLIILMTLVYEYNFAVFISMFFMCLIAIYGTRNVMNRRDITKTGFYIGFFNLFTIIAMHYFYILPGRDILKLFGWGCANGFASAIITMGLLPYLESIFSMISNIKLLELADFTQPILKRMMVEVPGTYHHSLIVGNLAEAAAREIGANPLLVRVGAYYHDIGKMEKAEYFFENKPRHMMNKHDDLKPNLSSLIIIAHVKDGVNMARKLKLSKKVIDIIEQHHGDNLVSYFYHKAQQEYGKDLDDRSYRYPGPKPKSKEAAIIMLADPVEAATHSETDYSHSHIKMVVNKIINQKFIDGQLEEAEITLSDLNIISKSFVQTLVGIYHNRIAYPDTKKEENEDKILK